MAFMYDSFVGARGANACVRNLQDTNGEHGCLLGGVLAEWGVSLRSSNPEPLMSALGH